MTLKPSVSRQQYGSIADWEEACEIASLHFFGTLCPAQIEWIETYNEVPPRSCDIELEREYILQAVA